MAQYGFYCDTEKCIKCWSCEVACKQWHDIPAGGVAMRRVYEKTEGTFPNVKRTFYSASCVHCADAVCVDACPVGIMTKRPEDGIVVVDEEQCIVCDSCITACPYDIPELAEDTVKICDCCISVGITPGDTPYCVRACPTKALQFGIVDESAPAPAAGDLLAAVTIPLKEPNPDPSDFAPETIVMTADDLKPQNEEAEGGAASSDSAQAAPNSGVASSDSAR